MCQGREEMVVDGQPQCDNVVNSNEDDVVMDSDLDIALELTGAHFTKFLTMLKTLRE